MAHGTTSSLRGALAAAAFTVLHAGGSLAQSYADILHPAPAQRMAAAFDTEYGRLLVAEFGRILRASADGKCLESKRITPQMLIDRGRELLVLNGTRVLEAHRKLVTPEKVDDVFARSMGGGAKAEFERLNADPGVKKLLALEERVRLANLVDLSVEYTDRHALLVRIEFNPRLSPHSSGNAALLKASPLESSLDEMDRLIAKSPRLKRWSELDAAYQRAYQRAIDQDALMLLGPREMTPDTVSALAGLCVFPLRIN